MKRSSFEPRPLRLLATLVCAVVAGGACYPLPTSSDAASYDTVITSHDENAPFGSYRTFAVPDSVVHIRGDGDNEIPVTREFDDAILARAVANMEARGYVREAAPETNGVDLVLLVGAVATSSTSWYVSYPWYPGWGWWPGWGYRPPGYWGPGWGWGYPPQVTGVTVETGTVLLTMVDPAASDETTETLPVVWAGSVRGLLSAEVTEERITRGIDQAFDQSPYLGANP